MRTAVPISRRRVRAPRLWPRDSRQRISGDLGAVHLGCALDHRATQGALCESDSSAFRADTGPGRVETVWRRAARYTASSVSKREACSEPPQPTHAARARQPGTCRALARAALGHRRREWLERSRVPAGSHADEHLVDGARVERVLGAERFPRWQLDLRAIKRARPGRRTCTRRPPVTSSPRSDRDCGCEARSVPRSRWRTCRAAVRGSNHARYGPGQRPRQGGC